MVGFSWQNADLKDLTSTFKAYGEQVQGVAEQIVAETVDEAAWDMRGLIETRGTGYQDRPGRVETGYMLGDVAENATELEVSGSTVTGRFGWGVNGGDVPDYYKHQEQGFRHWISGKDVPPMHALLDAFVKARANLWGKILRAVK